MNTVDSTNIMYYDAEQKQFITVTVDPVEAEQHETEDEKARAGCLQVQLHRAFA